MKQIQRGFIGCGDVTEVKSGPAFSQVEGSKVVAVMSRTADKARSYAERHNIPTWYTDAQALIDDPNVNAVYVATPPSSHATYAIMAMRAGKPVYIEKPLAASYEDCARINHVSQETHVPCYVAYYRRYLPYFLKVKELIEQQRIGKVQNVHIRLATPPHKEDFYDESLQPWRIKSDIAGGGYFYDLAPHQFDLLQEYFGVITHAEGFSSNRGGLYKAEDTVGACFKFANGIVGSGSWCFVAQESAKEDRIELIGDRGLICFSVFQQEPIRLHLEDGVHEFDIKHPPHVEGPIIKAVVETLQGKRDTQCTALSATPTNWVIDKILGKF